MKSTLTFRTIVLPAAGLGEEDPLPDLAGMGDLHGEARFDPSVPQGERQYFDYGKVRGILPYRLQNGYDRVRTPREIFCAVLENEHLRAEFLPDLGGRLRSLYDKALGRDLLHVNPVFQPANLGLRNAWVSGGVEWNIGTTGHSPFTLAPLHTTALTQADGTPMLRMYEWERMRQVTFQLDAYLPEGSRHLFLRVQLKNTRDEEVPIYWWSNIAVDETPDTRVLTPADQAFCYDFSQVVSKREIPVLEGADTSYPARFPRSIDLFYDIPQGRRKWEAALDGRGAGLVHTSTDRLQGRKLFMWGAGPGGKRWQTFLSEPGQAYLEIQAGLAKTQMEHLPMPAGARWEWLEAYGAMGADPGRIHGADWQAACDCCEEQLERDLPRALLDRELERLHREPAPPAPVLRYGSGWGALELRRLNRAGTFPCEEALFEGDSMGEDQAPWLELLETGAFPNRAPGEAPAPYLTQADWLPLLEEAVQSGRSDHWHGWLQLGVMHAAQGDTERAYRAFQTSLARTPNGWARRNLAILIQKSGEIDRAADLLLEAYREVPIPRMAMECGAALLDAGRWGAFRAFYATLPKGLREKSRMQAMGVRADIGLGELDRALAALNALDGVDDMREGEALLSDLWVLLHTGLLARAEGLAPDEGLRQRVLQQYPIPPRLDFRMRPDKI